MELENQKPIKYDAIKEVYASQFIPALITISAANETTFIDRAKVLFGIKSHKTTSVNSKAIVKVALEMAEELMNQSRN